MAAGGAAVDRVWPGGDFIDLNRVAVWLAFIGRFRESIKQMDPIHRQCASKHCLDMQPLCCFLSSILCSLWLVKVQGSWTISNT